ncbi:MAG: cytochrome c [Myxococcales bacterium]|nr:cytochrome c [Myxococcales bacterium]
MVFGLLTLLTLMAACGGDPEPIRQWRPEDHNHPLAAPTPGTAAPQAPGAGAAAEAEDPAAAELRAARALFNVSCAGCHGRDGSGNGPERPPGAQMPDLRSAALHQGRSDAELTQVIAEGRNMMPSFRDKISGEGIAALLRYVRSLAPSATANGAATTQDGGTNAASKAAAKAAAKAP